MCIRDSLSLVRALQRGLFVDRHAANRVFGHVRGLLMVTDATPLPPSLQGGAPEPQGVPDDGDRAQAHRGARDDRREEEAEEGVENAFPLGASSSEIVRGSSAIPQIGHEPGEGRTISGCIGHVYSTPAPAGAGVEYLSLIH